MMELENHYLTTILVIYNLCKNQWMKKTVGRYLITNQMFKTSKYFSERYLLIDTYNDTYKLSYKDTYKLKDIYRVRNMVDIK